MTYRPRQIAPNDWERLRAFAIAAVRTCNPQRARQARNLLSTLTRFLLWATGELQLPLDREELFHPAYLSRFAKQQKAPESRLTVENRLRTIALGLHGTPIAGRIQHWPRTVRPYDDNHMRELSSWASSLRTPSARENAGLLLAFCGGAGLRSEELMHTLVEDVQFDERGACIRIHHHPLRPTRLVPVQDEFAAYLEVLRNRPATSWAFFPRRTTTVTREFQASRFPQHSTPAPLPNRLRDTWLLGLLRRLPIADVMSVAGVDDAGMFQRFAGFLTPRPETELHAALRGITAEESNR